jgi:hypothetical protein
MKTNMRTRQLTLGGAWSSTGFSVTSVSQSSPAATHHSQCISHKSYLGDSVSMAPAVLWMHRRPCISGSFEPSSSLRATRAHASRKLKPASPP